MAGVEDVRTGIALADEKASEDIAAARQAIGCLEQAQQTLAAATQGGGQEETSQPHARPLDVENEKEEGNEFSVVVDRPIN